MARDDSAVGWGEFHKRLPALGLPQIPDADVVARFASHIAGHAERVLLLGITRALAELGSDLTAVDSNATQIEKLWPGDRPNRRAIHDDWRTMNLAPGRFSAAVGDGSLSTLAWPTDYAVVFARVAGALAPEGRLVVRCFLAPDEPETLEQIVRDVHCGDERSLHALRWRVAMAAAGASGNVAVSRIHDAFCEAFPDWPKLAERTGWDLAVIQQAIGTARNSQLVYSFVTRQRVLDTLPANLVGARFVTSGEYPLSDRCPFLVAERAG